MEIKILIVDDHPVIRYGLCKLLSAEPEFQVIGDAENSAECCEKVGKLKPDVVILDLEMNDSHRSTAISSLRTQHPKIKIIVYTAFNNDWIVNEVIKAGVQGYVVKNSDLSNLMSAIRIVSQGEHYLDPLITSKFIRTAGLLEKRKQQHCVISEREVEILQLVTKGYRNKEIAKSLAIEESTVKYHLSSIFTKLSVSNRTEAVLVAKEQGIFHD